MNLRLAPEQASNFALPYDILFNTFTILSVVFTIIVFAMILFFVSKYRRGRKADRSNPMHHNTRVELILLGIPTLLGLAMFAYSTKIYVDMRTVPEDAYEVFVIGKQWMWHMQHPNGIRENNELHVPLGQPVKLTLISQAVIHGFYLPEMRVQYQVVPGRYTKLWFKPTKAGRFHIWCTIHCGTQHSEMGGYIYVMEPKQWAEWVANDGNRFRPRATTLAQAGEQRFKELACGTCHGEKDSPQGPSLKGLLGKERVFTDGSRTVADEGYIRESIINPYARLNAGYGETMPVYVYKEQISEEGIREIIEYIKSLGGAAPTASPATTPTGANQ